MREVILRPVTSEKAVREMEAKNVLTFIVDNKMDKVKIKKTVQDLFKVKVLKVRTLNTPKNEKKAYVTISDADNALDLGADLGMI